MKEKKYYFYLINEIYLCKLVLAKVKESAKAIAPSFSSLLYPKSNVLSGVFLLKYSLKNFAPSLVILLL
jgi:hypothetical protein